MLVLRRYLPLAKTRLERWLASGNRYFTRLYLEHISNFVHLIKNYFEHCPRAFVRLEANFIIFKEKGEKK